jgi:hypothetical protein
MGIRGELELFLRRRRLFNAESMGGCAEGELDGSTEFKVLCAGRRDWFAALSMEIMAGLGLKVTFRAPFFGASIEDVVRDGNRGELSVVLVLVEAIVYQ